MRSSVSKGTKVYLDLEMAVVFNFSYIFVFIPINCLRVVRINQEVCVCERKRLRIGTVPWHRVRTQMVVYE